MESREIRDLKALVAKFTPLNVLLNLLLKAKENQRFYLTGQFR